MKTSTITTTTYTAEDGTTFTDKKMCEDYESELNHKNILANLTAIINKIECVEDGKAPFGYYYTDSERYEYRWYRPKNTDEILALNEFFDLVTKENEITETAIGEWICIEIEGGYENYAGEEETHYVGELDVTIAHIVEFYAKLGYKVTITEEG